jgi:hypothetical protein
MSLFPASLVQATDNNGDPVSGAIWKFYLTGTLTPAAVYSDHDFATSLGATVTSDSAGWFVPIYLDDSVTYRAVLTTSAGGVLGGHDVDPVSNASGYFSVATRTAMAALTSYMIAGTTVMLSEAGREGLFILRAGVAPTDTLQGIYVPSDTSGYYWERVWSGNPDAGWFGAALDDGGTDSAAAIQACLSVTGRMHFPVGYYYGASGLVVGDSQVITGDGPLVCGYICSSATDHLLDHSGTTSAFINGGDFEGFTLSRSVTPTTPADPADDRTQGHGLHLDLVSNVRINRVYTYNNLAEVYVARTLAAQIENVRGLRQTGGASDRWTGLMVYGDPTGMPGGWATGPSGNPSCTIKKIQMVAASGLASSINFSLKKQLQDLWIEDPEAGGGHTQYDIDPDGTTAGDFFIIRPVADGYLTNGYNIRDLPLDASLIIRDAWVAPAAGATSSGVLLNGAHGLDMNVKGNFTMASGLTGVGASDCSQMKIDADMVNCQYPFTAGAINSSEIKIRGSKKYIGANFGNVADLTNSHSTTLDICTFAFDTQKYLTAANIDNLSTGLTINVTRTYAGSAADKIKVNGVAVTTQGNVSGHVIINPGAGAML